MKGSARSDDILASLSETLESLDDGSKPASTSISGSGRETETSIVPTSKRQLKPTDTYVLDQSISEDALVSARIATGGGSLASFARSLRPSQLTRADLNAMALEQYAICVEDDRQREAASVLKTLYEINKDKITERARNVSLDLVSEAMKAMRDQAITVEPEEVKP